VLKIAYSPIFCLPLPPNHRFPMEKYRLLPQKLLQENVITIDNLFTPQKASKDEILTTHTHDYYHALINLNLTSRQARMLGLPLTHDLIEREHFIAHATYECALHAQKHGISLSTSGGTHHAFAGHGEGFCIFNDICVASHLLLQRNQAKRILIVDLDVHQGNGNASIMANNPNVFVFSMHGKKNYPFRKIPSDLDIDLDDGTTDDEYLAILDENLTKIMIQFYPDLIFYQAGVDVLDVDKLGKLNLTMSGVSYRDERVLMCAKKAGIPIVVVMGGGYAPDIAVIVEAHSQVYYHAKKLWG
jgi:histone deacetylase family protein